MSDFTKNEGLIQ